MTTKFLWDVGGSNGYQAAVANFLSTELNALASSSGNVLSTLGAAFDNHTSASWIYDDVEFVAGGTFTPVAGGFIELWLLRSLDGGTNYPDGSATIAPARPADIIIPVRAGTTITPRADRSGLILPPGFYKPIARNQTGATLPATLNLIRQAPYVEAY